MEISERSPIRFLSLDVFRGMTVAGMILVNMASIAEPDVYPPLLHAPWNGWTVTDLIFPFFLFAVGMAIAFAFAKYAGRQPPTTVYWRILRRAAILFILGLLLNGFWNKGIWTFDFSSIRIMGVLQRISITYLLASLAVLKLPPKGIWILAGVLLLGYWLVMMYLPVPGIGAGELTRTSNFGAYIDRLIIPSPHLYGGDEFNFMGDPEGLFSTIPAVVSTLAGYLTGKWLHRQAVQSRTSIGLILFGIGCLIAGGIWGLVFPINKKLWTSSYVVFTTGWALLLLAPLYELIEVRQIRKWSQPFAMMGMNAITIFIASILMIKIFVKTKIGSAEDAPTTYKWIYDHVFTSWAGAVNGSLLFAIATLLLWFLVAYIMYRHRWFIKV